MLKTTFDGIFASASRAIAFNPVWKNSTGYLDGAAIGKHAPVLADGEVVRTVDDYGRPVVLLGMGGGRLGNIVVFKRYADPSSTVVVKNVSSTMSTMLNGLVSTGAQNEHDLAIMFGENFVGTLANHVA